MKLVTYQSGRRGARAGALIDGGRRVLDLQEAHRVHEVPQQQGMPALCSAQWIAAEVRQRAHARGPCLPQLQTAQSGPATRPCPT